MMDNILHKVLIGLWSICLVLWLVIPNAVIVPLGDYLEQRFPNPPDGKSRKPIVKEKP